MSDAPQGPGWWQASDGKWYPPEQASGGAPAPGGGGTGAATDLGTVLGYGWNKFIANIGDIIIIWLIVIGVQVVFNVLSQVTRDTLVVSILLSLVGFVVGMIVQIGLIRVGLLVTSGTKVTPAAAFDTTNLGPFVIASILYGVGVFLGLIVLCIGALIVGFLFWFYGYYVLDANQDPVASLRSSFELTTQNFGTVGLYALVAIVLGICTCGLAWPILQIGAAYLYRTLNGQAVAA